MQGSPVGSIATWKRSHDHIPADGHHRQELVTDGAKTAPNQIAGHGTTHGLGHDEPEPARLGDLSVEHVQHRIGRPDTPAAAHRSAEVTRPGHAIGPGEHR